MLIYRHPKTFKHSWNEISYNYQIITTLKKINMTL